MPLLNPARFARLALAVALGWFPTPGIAAEKSATASPTVFAPTSFWYQPLPKEVPLHADSDQLVAEFLRQKKKYYNTVTINTAAFSCPVYIVSKEMPTVRVEEWDGQNKGFKNPKLAAQWEAVPIPDYAAPADGTDAEMCIYQPETDTLWEFWNTRKREGQWEACWGGKMTNVSRNPGIWPDHFGTTATSLPFLGGQLTAEELRSGVIHHVIGIALVDCEEPQLFSWPAQRSDGANPERVPHRIQEGQRFRLDPTVDVEALSMHPVGKIIARAAQQYGFVVWDRAGAISLRAENPKGWTQKGLPDPYPEIFKGAAGWEILQGFPWEKLQFLPRHYGKPSEPVSQ